MTILRTLGKLLISVGMGVLLFVAWTLWGTGISTGIAQDELDDELDRATTIQARQPPGAERADVKVDPSFKPDRGDPVFRMAIPRIDTSHVVVQGVGTEELRKGPGHYPNCRRGFTKPLCTDEDEVWPGEVGRVILSGHRTTYGAPFGALDKLQEGDPIRLETRWGDFVYEVTGSKIVLPNATDIATPESDKPELVLTTCHPRGSAAQRLVVEAELAESST